MAYQSSLTKENKGSDKQIKVTRYKNHGECFDQQLQKCLFNVSCPAHQGNKNYTTSANSRAETPWATAEKYDEVINSNTLRLPTRALENKNNEKMQQIKLQI